MKRFLSIFCLGAAAGAIGLLAGCDREVSHTSHTDVDDDQVKTRETRVVEKADGQVQVQKQTTTKDLEDGQTTTKTQTQTHP